MGDYFVEELTPASASTSSAQGAGVAAAVATASTAVTSTPNKDLTGHKLVFLTPFAVSAAWVAAVRATYPGLEVVDLRFDPWRPGGAPQLPDDLDWTSVTILVTGPALPTPEKAPRLRLVQLQSAGANYALDTPLFKEPEVVFCTANGVHGPQIAEWVLATYLTFQHRLLQYHEKQKEAHWDLTLRHLDTLDVVRQRVGILGYGSIGRQVARIMTATGAEVYAYTARPRPTPESRHDDAYYVPGLGDPEGVLPAKWFSGTSTAEINAFLASGLDLLVIALPLTDQTRGMLGEAQFRVLAEAAGVFGVEGDGDKKKAGPKTYVTNIGRGPVIRTDDLIAALDAGWIRGAALDVTDPEPLPDGHPLWRTANVTITPHISGNSIRYVDRLLDIMDVNLARLSRGEDKLINQVNKKRGY